MLARFATRFSFAPRFGIRTFSSLEGTKVPDTNVKSSPFFSFQCFTRSKEVVFPFHMYSLLSSMKVPKTCPPENFSQGKKLSYLQFPEHLLALAQQNTPLPSQNTPTNSQLLFFLSLYISPLSGHIRKLSSTSPPIGHRNRCRSLCSRQRPLYPQSIRRAYRT